MECALRGEGSSGNGVCLEGGGGSSWHIVCLDAGWRGPRGRECASRSGVCLEAGGRDGRVLREQNVPRGNGWVCPWGTECASRPGRWGVLGEHSVHRGRWEGAGGSECASRSGVVGRSSGSGVFLEAGGRVVLGRRSLPRGQGEMRSLGGGVCLEAGGWWGPRGVECALR
ncbi:hypothetical protein KY285_035698 [Solanum tuberosum]|nr:hypothetical protein KY285_035698 [Solanum tuberosum]